MTMFAGLDVGGKRTAVCVIDAAGKIVWRGMVDTHPEMIDAALERLGMSRLTMGAAALGQPSSVLSPSCPQPMPGLSTYCSVVNVSGSRELAPVV